MALAGGVMTVATEAATNRLALLLSSSRLARLNRNITLSFSPEKAILHGKLKILPLESSVTV